MCVGESMCVCRGLIECETWVNGLLTECCDGIYASISPLHTWSALESSAVWSALREVRREAHDSLREEMEQNVSDGQCLYL